jgi:acyl carrier protein
VPAETHMERQPLTREDVERIIQDQVGEILAIDPDSVKVTDRFAEDLRADSLALVELVDMLEEELSERTAGFEFDDEDLADLVTVADAVDYVMARVGG